ncbi:MAG: nuclear transport factor 2 family protein [Betaproteobacteria bacterium]|nr:nuclear transport factor 2 family protein [Betaproteobacteria bacterium]
MTDGTDDAVLVSGATVFSVEEARKLVAWFAEVTTARRVDEFLSGFTEDCVVQYGGMKPLAGRSALRPLARQLLGPRYKDLLCQKALRSLNGNVIGASWISEWTDAETGERRSGRGLEFWILRGRQIARWDAAFVAANEKALA